MVLEYRGVNYHSAGTNKGPAEILDWPQTLCKSKDIRELYAPDTSAPFNLIFAIDYFPELDGTLY